MPLQMNAVYSGKAPAAGYAVVPGLHLPEVPKGTEITTSLVVLRSLFMQAGLDKENQGAALWNPLSTIIGSNDKVVLKPNWVHHRNGSGDGTIVSLPIQA